MTTTDLRRFTCGRCGAIQELELTDNTKRDELPDRWGRAIVEAGDGAGNLDRLLCPGCGPKVLDYAASTQPEDAHVIDHSHAAAYARLYAVAGALVVELGEDANGSDRDIAAAWRGARRIALRDELRELTPRTAPSLVRPSRYPEG